MSRRDVTNTPSGPYYKKKKSKIIKIKIVINCGTNIRWIESWSKRKGLGADLVRKYEDSETKICLPKVRSLARPCHPP
ncbi:hypothetical protein MTR_3g092540 [Medicago truncatula]|uniref:Uncharacterized protein n=1 Tax=Medicago truncatula TaxID=3880 RepID=G7J8X8_MEDTR|nr:hypothetical protein MTR_3g092540 [Medicago truncatula]